ncbi:hypothetical protein HDU97_003920 [Phlyctochytrium planicorne]|nr:hypothetical protein HDU97_003920 [Phlyctochytrium planicorne]
MNFKAFLLSFITANTVAMALPAEAPLPITHVKVPTPAGLYATDSEIQAMCQAGPKTQWDRHICQALGNVQDGCMPQKRFAYGNRNATGIKGLILIYHGYTACPDAMEGLGAFLQQQGYHTITPLNIGHGKKMGDCNRPGAVCIRNTPIDGLPVKKEAYIDFVNWSVGMVREELAAIPMEARAPNFTVGVTGLSLGGPLAAVAAQVGGDLFTRAALVNPFFSAAVQFLDFQVADCQASSDPQACINKLIDGFQKTDAAADAGKPTEPGTQVGISRIFNWLQEKSKGVVSMIADRVIGNLLLNRYNALMRLLATTMATIDANNFISENVGFLNSSYGWGEDCFVNTARPGYCIFQVRNLVALSSFGTYALSRAAKTTNKNIGFITTERDGPVRNGLTYAAASVYAAKGNSVEMCMFTRPAGCSNSMLLSGSNECGVPHSSFSRNEMTNTAPYNMYWESNMFDNILKVLQGAQTIGAPAFVDRGTCTNVKLGALNTYKTQIYDVSDIIEDSIARWSS